jgi:hypothetical protein
MIKQNEPEIDWSLCTWKGSRRKQHQEFHAIPFSRKMEIVEEMNNSIRNLQERQLLEKGLRNKIANFPGARPGDS